MGKVAVSYLRRSTVKQENSIRDQRRMIEDFAVRHGYAIVREFVDDGVSGVAKAKKRQAFLQMIEFVENNEFNVEALLVYDISRFGRMAPNEAAYYRHRLRQVGCEVIYVAEHLPHGNSRSLVRSVLQWHMREQVKQMARDIIRTQVSLAEQGFRVGGQAPFGYRLCYISKDGTKREPENRKPFCKQKGERVILVPDSHEKVSLVRWIFQMYTQEELGDLRIAEKLNEGRIAPPRARDWTKTTVKSILRNPVYAGTACYNRRSQSKLYSIEKKRPKAAGNEGRCSPNPRSEWVMVENAHKALVDRKMFEMAQKIRERRAAKRAPTRCDAADGSPRETGHPQLLLGMVYCGHCGSKMTSNRMTVPGKKKKLRYVRYVCAGYRSKGKFFCLPYAIDSNKLDGLILSLLREFLVSYKRQTESTQKGRQFRAGNDRKEQEAPTEIEHGESTCIVDCQNRVVPATGPVFPERYSGTTLPSTNPETNHVWWTVRDAVRFLVDKVTLCFLSDQRGSKRALYRLVNVTIEVNNVHVLRVDKLMTQMKRFSASTKVLQFGAKDIEFTQNSSFNTVMLNFLNAYLVLLSNHFSMPCSGASEKGFR